jgi:lysophospholipase L1-like esterase
MIRKYARLSHVLAAIFLVANLHFLFLSKVLSVGLALIALAASPRLLTAFVFSFSLWMGLNNISFFGDQFSNEWFGVLSFLVCIILFKFKKEGLGGLIGNKLIPQESRAFSLLTVSLVLLSFLLIVLSLFRGFPSGCFLWGLLAAFFARELFKKKPLWRLGEALGFLVMAVLLLLTTLLLTEAGGRILFPDYYWYRELYYEADEELIFTFIPGRTGVESIIDNDNNKKTIEMKISEQGLRDRFHPPRVGNEYRILLAGDSYTLGMGLHQEETIASQLEKLLNDWSFSRSFRVMNAGVGGYAPWQERIFLERRGYPLDPDLVILQLFPANDVAGSYNQTRKYLQAVDYRWEDRVTSFREKRPPFLLERWAKGHSLIYQMLSDRRDMSLSLQRVWEACRLLPQYGPVNYPPISDRPAYQEVCLVDWYPELHEAWALYAGAIHGIRDDCRARNIKLAAWAHGEAISLQPDFWEGLNGQFPGTTYEMNKDLRLTREVLEELGIPCIDVLTALERAESPEDLYYIYDGHFSVEGARLIAQTLAVYILKQLAFL